MPDRSRIKGPERVKFWNSYVCSSCMLFRIPSHHSYENGNSLCYQLLHHSTNIFVFLVCFAILHLRDTIYATSINVSYLITTLHNQHYIWCVYTYSRIVYLIFIYLCNEKMFLFCPFDYISHKIAVSNYVLSVYNVLSTDVLFSYDPIRDYVT